MKRFILLVLVLMASSAGVVAANNTFKGHPIVTVQYNGQTVNPDGVPAYLEDGYTMIPLGLLRKMGFKVEWDNATKTANVVTKEKRVNPTLTLEQIKSHEGLALIYALDEKGNRLTRGSGFMLNSKGLLITARHVIVEGGKHRDLEIIVRGRTYFVPAGATVFEDADKDIAGLFLYDKDPFPHFFPGEVPKKGDTVYALGNPAGQFRVFRDGKVQLTYTKNGTNIMTDVVVEGGFSGGPLLNQKGEVVGIITGAILGLGFASAMSIDDAIEAYRNF